MIADIFRFAVNVKISFKIKTKKLIGICVESNPMTRPIIKIDIHIYKIESLRIHHQPQHSEW